MTAGSWPAIQAQYRSTKLKAMLKAMLEAEGYAKVSEYPVDASTYMSDCISDMLLACTVVYDKVIARIRRTTE